jgi:hypothetical protein
MHGLIIAIALLLVVPPAAAAQSNLQSNTTNAVGGAPFLVELRVGALWPHAPVIVDFEDLDTSTTRPSAGGRLNLYFGSGRFERRLSFQIAVDWAELGASEFVDERLGSGARAEGHWVSVVPALGVDLVRTPRLSADARIGPAILVDLTTFLLQRHDPDFDESDFENVCDLVAFKDRCNERVRGGGAVGVGARFIVKPSWKLFVGFDYTRFTTGRNVLVATVGRDAR